MPPASLWQNEIFTNSLVSNTHYTDFLCCDGYRGDGASAIHIRSMLQASTGSWADSWGSYTQPGLPLVRSTSMSSWRLVSHLIGSPNKTIAAVTREVNQTSKTTRQHFITFRSCSFTLSQMFNRLLFAFDWVVLLCITFDFGKNLQRRWLEDTKYC